MSTDRTPDFLTDAVQRAAFPAPGRVEPTPKQDAPCADEACEHRAWGNPTLAPDYMRGTP